MQLARQTRANYTYFYGSLQTRTICLHTMTATASNASYKCLLLLTETATAMTTAMTTKHACICVYFLRVFVSRLVMHLSVFSFFMCNDILLVFPVMYVCAYSKLDVDCFSCVNMDHVLIHVLFFFL